MSAVCSGARLRIYQSIILVQRILTSHRTCVFLSSGRPLPPGYSAEGGISIRVQVDGLFKTKDGAVMACEDC
jgi:hypothetical protein